jgi:hypothetical protein
MSNLTNPEVLRALTPTERDEAAIRISGLVEALRSLVWVAQSMTPGGCEGPAPDEDCDRPNGAGPDWSALVARAESAIADATTGGLEVFFPLRMVKGDAFVLAGDAVSVESYLAQGFVVPAGSSGSGYFRRIDGPIPADPTSPEYFAWSIRREVRDGDVAAAVFHVARLREEALKTAARANAAAAALVDAIDAG